MSLITMAKRLVMEVPGLAEQYAVTLLNEALGLIYDSQLWSFQLKTGGYLTSGLLFPTGVASVGQSQGTVSVTAFSDQVTGDATAAALWVAYNGAGTRPLLTELQFRSPYYSLYNIVAFDGVNKFTLDRPWMEPTNATATYMIYQAYFPAPVSDFKRFLWARDTTMNAPIDFWSLTQKQLASLDPQRTIFNLPSYFVAYQPDARAGSATLGNMLYELWPGPLSQLPYTFGYLRRGVNLVNQADTVPYPITEEAVLWRAKEVAYQWKEAQKGEQMQRGSGADFRFLSQAASQEYKAVIQPISRRDRDLVDLYWTKWCPDYYLTGQPYATINSQLNVGRF